ncbi:thioredoxin-dependent thiol peroxidase [Naumannella halotolerans]|uniref:thioredoxin-dependent thiol peroxidase n=1 Tax=Naumannella halotolerans TaxID=993414 RepID=UPI00370DBDAD
MSTRLDVGSTAPTFTLTSASGDQVSLSDFAGQRVIVYFYPAAMTPGCTTQAVDFTAAEPDLSGAGLKVLGLSPDPVDKLQKFQQKEHIAIELLSDPDKAVHNAYGAYGTKKLYGKEVEGVIRSTFIVDVDDSGVGTIAVAQYNVKATGHVDRLRKQIGV